MDEAFTTDRFEAELRKELARGERLLWHARAIPRAKKGSMAIVLFAIPWTGFALFWTGMAFFMTRGSDAGVMGYLFPAFGLPFIAIGLWMFARPLLSRVAAGRMAFGITDHRVIQLYLGKGTISESVEVGRIASLSRHERGDGSGSLKLTMKSGATDSEGGKAASFDLGEVAGVRQAESALRDAMKRAGSPSP